MATIAPVNKYLSFGFVLVLLLWLVGTLVFLPPQSKLETAARALLADQDGDGRPDTRNAFSRVTVSFSGQEATLGGVVATDADKEQATNLVATQVKLDGWLNGHLCPVTAVHTDSLQVDPALSPRPHPWFLITLYGGQQRVDGLLGSPDQLQELLAALAGKLPPPVMPIHKQVMISLDALSPAAWPATIANLPDLTSHPQDRSLIVTGTGDGKWNQLPPEATTEEVSAALGGVVANDEINHALGKLRTWKDPTPIK